MRYAPLLAAALTVLSVRAEPVEARSSGQDAGRPSTSSGRTDLVAAVDAVVRGYGLAGEVLVAKGDHILLDRGYGPIAPTGGALHKAVERWRLASITKQVTAALVVSRLVPIQGLDRTATELKMPRLGVLTPRQLLTHHSGLANPDATPLDAAGVPHFYAGQDDEYCLSKPPSPGAAFAYNNCDYLMLSRLYEATVQDESLQIARSLAAPGDQVVFHVVGGPGLRWPVGLAMARPNEVGVPGYVHGKPEPTFQLASYGAAGGLMGTAKAVFAFDRSLMTGKLLPPAALAELWKPEGHGSYQALGQWVFPGQLKGCAVPRRIVQRDGEIWGVQARNYILPDDDLVVIVFTNRSADDFAIGEVWEGKGFAYDLLSAAAC